jgi:hypothetical protein
MRAAVARLQTATAHYGVSTLLSVIFGAYVCLDLAIRAGAGA